ncbi:hypothetical protein AGMMS49965_26210 [Bacteroidia bacterium]|nr:hypothetical protein AGMMS49965_26210 [Bacteroidia bacterium]
MPFTNVTGIRMIAGITNNIHPFDKDLHIKHIKQSIDVKIINGNSNTVNK